MTEHLDHLMKAFELPLTDPVLAFALILFIILLSPILFQKVNTPGIIGLIVAGIIIGPHGLGIIAPEMLTEGSALTWFSTIGLLYIMFIAGLELDMNEFRSNRNKSLIFGFYTFAIPLLIGYPVCRYFLDYDFNTSLLTASMFATHTLVAYPIASRMGVSRNPAVAVTVGGTILTDTAVLVILAVILGNAQGQLDPAFFLKLVISLAIFTLLMFQLVPRIAGWFFRHFNSEKHSHYVFVLGIMFLASYLAEVAGVEAIIGAFVAGLALNKLIPTSSALMNRIEFIGNSLFIPFFLINVGMMVNIQVVLSGWSVWIVAATLTVVAVLSKWLAALCTQLSFKYSRPQRQLVFGLSGAHAAATLAVIMVGHEAGIINDHILNGTIILILITSMIASFATEKACSQLAHESDDDDDNLIQTSGASSEHILMPISKVDHIEPSLEFSVLIKDKKSPNPISVLTVVSNDNESEINILKAKSRLERVVRDASASETHVDILTTIDHDIPGGIARMSREIMADMIILGWPKREGLFDRLTGDWIEGILNKTYKTTFLCQFEKPLSAHKRIVITAPPLTECEKGFPLWVNKLILLARELSIPLVVYCNDTTREAFETLLAKKTPRPAITLRPFNDWEDFLVLSGHIHADDLLVTVAARPGAQSHMPMLDQLPSWLEKYFTHNNFMVIYPQHHD